MTDHEVLVFVTTMNCNRHCKFCNQERNHMKFGCSITDMSVETFIELVSKHPDNATITLSGGEPFLNLPIMEWLVKKNRPFCVQTNGDFLFPKDWKIPENTQVRISMNELEYPPLLNWALKHPEVNIRINTYLNDPKKTFDIIQKMSELPNIYDVTVHVDFYTDYTEEMTQKVEELASLCSCLPLPQRNARFGVLKGYDSYMRSLWHPGETFIYGMDGTRIPSIYAAGIEPCFWPEFLGGWVYKDYECYSLGKSLYQEEHPEKFHSVCAYYLCHFYESIKKAREKKIDAFNKIFGNPR